MSGDDYLKVPALLCWFRGLLVSALLAFVAWRLWVLSFAFVLCLWWFVVFGARQVAADRARSAYSFNAKMPR